MGGGVNVRFGPDSCRDSDQLACPLRANNRRTLPHQNQRAISPSDRQPDSRVLDFAYACNPHAPATPRGAPMIRTTITAAALALAVTLPAVPAQAAAGRTFVSAAGSDTNPCTITMPCRNRQAAYNAVAPNGEVEALDPGNYGSLTITGPVTIQGHGWAGMSTTTGAAITINAAGATDKINIFGVVADGLGISGTNGIVFNSGGTLTVRDSVIRNFSGTGIYFVPNINSNLFVSNTLVADNGSDGIAVFPTSAGVQVLAVFNHVEANNNSNHGIGINTSRGFNFIYATASESVAAGNGVGFYATASPQFGTGTYLTLFHCVAVNNGTGIEANGYYANISVEQSNLNRNINNSYNSGDGSILTYGDNYDDGTGSGTLVARGKF